MSRTCEGYLYARGRAVFSFLVLYFMECVSPLLEVRYRYRSFRWWGTGGIGNMATRRWEEDWRVSCTAMKTSR